LTCLHCGLFKEEPDQRRVGAGGTYPANLWTAMDLWLVGEFRGHRVWAYNERHLEQMRRYVAASLRERGDGERCGMSMIESLPGWMKEARNRAGLLREFDRMATRLEAPARG
jgi:hypothetical protein